MNDSISAILVATVFITLISNGILAKQFENQEKAFLPGFIINIIYTGIGLFLANTLKSYGDLAAMFAVFALNCTQIVISLIIASVKYYQRKKTIT